MAGNCSLNAFLRLMAVAAMIWLTKSSTVATSAGGHDVDLALVLAIDCSDSVDDGEFRHQLDGIARAFRHPSVIAAIREGSLQRIAVLAIEWSTPNAPVVIVDWSIVDSEAAAAAVARKVERARRLVIGGTSISAAIDASSALLIAAPLRASRMVIDISSDGTNNTGGRPELARDRAVALGITVNGLVILNEVPYLKFYFENRVIGGPGHFVIDAADYLAYEKAILKKLLREIVRPVA